MVKLTYRLVGSTSNPRLTREFSTRDAALQWASDQGNVLILEIQSTASAIWGLYI